MEVTKRTLEKSEIEAINNTKRKMAEIKLEIGNAEIRKQMLIYEYSLIEKQFSEIGDSLKARYGEDAVIDLHTGEVKQQSEDEDKKLQ